MCLVVGTCCRGFKENSTSDVIFSSATAKEVGQSLVQYFWEVKRLLGKHELNG